MLTGSEVRSIEDVESTRSRDVTHATISYNAVCVICASATTYIQQGNYLARTLSSSGTRLCYPGHSERALASTRAYILGLFALGLVPNSCHHHNG